MDLRFDTLHFSSFALLLSVHQSIIFCLKLNKKEYEHIRIQQNFKQDCKDSCPSVEHVRTLSRFISVALFCLDIRWAGMQRRRRVSAAVVLLLWLAADDITVETYCYGNQPVLTTGLRGVYSCSTHNFCTELCPLTFNPDQWGIHGWGRWRRLPPPRGLEKYFWT